jgi:hypothetical protein
VLCRLAYLAFYSCLAYSADSCPTYYCSKRRSSHEEPCRQPEKPSVALVFSDIPSSDAPFGVAMQAVADKCVPAVTAETCSQVGSVSASAAVAAKWRLLDENEAPRFVNLAMLQAAGVDVEAMANATGQHVVV